MMRTHTQSVLVAVALGLAACQDATAPETIDDTLLTDVALVAADAVMEDVALMTGPFGFGALGSPGSSPVPGRPGGMRGIGGERSGTRSVTFYDAAGNEQDHYDALTTASIHFISELSGEVNREGWSASVERSRDMVVSGLEGEETTRTFDGTGASTVARSRHLDDGSVRTYDMAGTSAHDAVVVPAPGSDSRWPLSGTVTRTMEVSVVNGPHGDVERSVTVVITFDGDETATATVNGETFEIDLSAREGRSPLRPRPGRTGG